MTYDRVKNIGPGLMYQKKQELNFIVQKIIKLYGKEDPFKALIFVAPKIGEGDEDDFADVKGYMKDEISFQMTKLKNDLIPDQKKILE